MRAKGSVINTEKNIHYECNTDSSGNYCFPGLPPGPYRIDAEAANFEKVIKPDVFLHLQDALEVNLEMKLGSISKSVIEGGASSVDTESAVVSTIIDPTFFEDLSPNGRSLQKLILLAPGAVLTCDCVR